MNSLDSWISYHLPLQTIHVLRASGNAVVDEAAKAEIVLSFEAFSAALRQALQAVPIDIDFLQEPKPM